MKTIKFRVWDKKNKKMLKPDHNGNCKVSPEVYDIAFLVMGLNGEVMKYERERTIGASYFSAGTQGQHEIDGTDENYILLQFTGLTDKNGKEIYDGDIIKCSAFQREREVIEDEIVEVKYGKGYFYPFGYNAGWRSDVVGIELLGNVYENANLLKENE